MTMDKWYAELSRCVEEIQLQSAGLRTERDRLEAEFKGKVKKLELQIAKIEAGLDVVAQERAKIARLLQTRSR